MMTTIKYPEVVRITEPFLEVTQYSNTEPIELDLSEVSEIDFFEIQKLIALIVFRKQKKLKTTISQASDYLEQTLSSAGISLTGYLL